MKIKTPINAFLIVLLLKCSSAYGQEIKLNVMTFNPCESTYERELLFSIVKGSRIFQISDTLGTIYLPEPGEYKLKPFTAEFYNLTDAVRDIKIVRGQNYDTLTQATINRCYI